MRLWSLFLAASIIGAACASGCSHNTPSEETFEEEVQPTHLCRTDCGMISSEGDCAALQRYETTAVAILPLALPWSRGQVCHALSGWVIVIHKRLPEDTVCSEHGWRLYGSKDAGDLFCAGGYTHSSEKWIELPDTDWEHGALAHETVHALDMTMTGSVNSHCRWGDPRLKTILYALTGEFDPTKPGASCDAGVADAGTRDGGRR